MEITGLRLEALYGHIPPSLGALPGEEGEGESSPLEHVYVRMETDEGPAGLYGPVDRRAAYHVAAELAPMLVGLDPLAGRDVWHRMARRFRRHGRAGALKMAISAVDNALWDLRGRHFGAPVYRLLGGPTRERIAAYVSALGFPQEPVPLARHARWLKEQGFPAQKWFFRWGERTSLEEVERDLALVGNVREAVGERYPIMFDAVMHWEPDYALAMAREMAPLRPKWLEEPVHATQLDAFVRINRDTAIPLAAGEHLYGRPEVRRFLDAGVLDFVQADPDWTGGVTELTRICALAGTYGVRVCPHGHTVHAAAHVIASQPASLCPMLEYLWQHAPRQQFFMKEPLVPEGGSVALPEAPGLGIELDDAKIEARRELSWE